MKVFFQRFFYLLIIVFISHVLDGVAIQYGKKQVAEYILSEKNPSRHLYSNEGELIKRDFGIEDNKAVAITAERILNIRGNVEAMRFGQQIVICFIFAFLFYWGGRVFGWSITF